MALLTPAAAAPTAGSIKATRLSLPKNAGPNSNGTLFAVDCVKPGSCTAGGAYDDRAGHGQPMVAASSGGRWARPIELRLPANADANPFGQVTAVDCTGAGDCVAVGYYNSAARLQAFVAAESAGRWRRAVTVTPPANTKRQSYFELLGLDCVAAGSCVAVGAYTDRAEHFEPMAVSESKGTWARATELPRPSNAAPSPNDFLNSVACTRAGSCVATGDYSDRAITTQGVIVTESGGRWRSATEIKLPGGTAPNPSVFAGSVTCPSSGSCVAVGYYLTPAGTSQAFAVAEGAHGWARATKIAALPANVGSPPSGHDRAVACVHAGFCVAGGGYGTHAGGAGSMATFESHGAWTKAAEIVPPSDAASGPNMNAEADAVGCTGTGYCVAVGDYAAKVSATTETIQPMAARVPAP